jgi:hypothetical protein
VVQSLGAKACITAAKENCSIFGSESVMFTQDHVPDDVLDRILAFLIVDDLFVVASTARAFHETVCRRAKVVDTGTSSSNVVTDARLRQLVHKFPATSTLRIPRAEKLSIEAVAAALHALDNLSTLSVHGVRWRGRQRPATIFEGMTGGAADEAAARLFPDHNGLKSLCVRGTVFLNYDELKGLMVSPDLRDVELCGLRHLGDGSLRSLLETSTPACGDRIERLLLSDCTGLEELDFAAHSVRELQLKHCVNLRAFKRSLPNLVTLNLEFCSKLPDAAVEAVMAQCPCLENLVLKGCSELRKPTLASSSLRRLDMR